MQKGSLLSTNPSLQPLSPPLPAWRRDSEVMQKPREFESEIKTPHALQSSCPQAHPCVVSLPACHIRCGVCWGRAATQPASATRKLPDTKDHAMARNVCQVPPPALKVPKINFQSKNDLPSMWTLSLRLRGWARSSASKASWGPGACLSGL